MPFIGEARRFLLPLSPVLVVAILLTAIYPTAFRFLGRYWGVGVIVGIELAAVGLVFWALATVPLVRAYRADRLATRGAFALSRHPIFAWWVFFILPAAAFITNSWLFLVAALAIGLLLRPAMKKEDTYLAYRYPEAHRPYRAQVRRLLPVPRVGPVSFRRYARGAGVLALLGVFALGVFLSVGIPVLERLGATRAEVAAELPGDRYVPSPRHGYTQAYTYPAPPAEVWPWLVQVGYHRAGWYNVDAINRLADPAYFIDGKHSATVIHLELQQLALGDTIGLAPGVEMVVTHLEPERLLVLVGDPSNPDAEMNVAWTYRMAPTGDGGTRMVVRFSSIFPGGFVAELLNGLVNYIGGGMIQQPAMLLGIDRRVR
jgi:protein-S-isoprenylcysteine O-methyltransferase Ste14